MHAAHGQAGLTPEQQRLVARLHSDFTRAGAQLPPAERAEFADLQARLAELTTRFAQNLLHDENAFTLPLPDEAAMAGLPEFVRAAARQAAADRGLATPVITLPVLDLALAELGHFTARMAIAAIFVAGPFSIGRFLEVAEDRSLFLGAACLRLRSGLLP